MRVSVRDVARAVEDRISAPARRLAEDLHVCWFDSYGDSRVIRELRQPALRPFRCEAAESVTRSNPITQRTAPNRTHVSDARHASHLDFRSDPCRGSTTQSRRVQKAERARAQTGIEPLMTLRGVARGDDKHPPRNTESAMKSMPAPVAAAAHQKQALLGRRELFDLVSPDSTSKPVVPHDFMSLSTHRLDLFGRRIRRRAMPDPRSSRALVDADPALVARLVAARTPFLAV